MRFYVRLAYYLSGFTIGMFFLMMVLNGKDTSCSYFPNARVLKDLRSKPFYYSNEVKQILTQKWVDTADIKKTLTYGDVDFGKSNLKFKGGKIYVIEGKTAANEKITLQVVNYSTKVLLKDIKKD
jgi:hypothetical protein